MQCIVHTPVRYCTSATTDSAKACAGHFQRTVQYSQSVWNVCVMFMATSTGVLTSGSLNAPREACIQTRCHHHELVLIIPPVWCAVRNLICQKQAQELSEIVSPKPKGIQRHRGDKLGSKWSIYEVQKLFQKRTKFWYPEEKQIIVAQWNGVIEI